MESETRDSPVVVSNIPTPVQFDAPNTPAKATATYAAIANATVKILSQVASNGHILVTFEIKRPENEPIVLARTVKAICGMYSVALTASARACVVPPLAPYSVIVALRPADRAVVLTRFLTRLFSWPSARSAAEHLICHNMSELALHGVSTAGETARAAGGRAVLRTLTAFSSLRNRLSAKVSSMQSGSKQGAEAESPAPAETDAAQYASIPVTESTPLSPTKTETSGTPSQEEQAEPVQAPIEGAAETAMPEVTLEDIKNLPPTCGQLRARLNVVGATAESLRDAAKAMARAIMKSVPPAGPNVPETLSDLGASAAGVQSPYSEVLRGRCLAVAAGFAAIATQHDEFVGAANAINADALEVVDIMGQITSVVDHLLLHGSLLGTPDDQAAPRPILDQVEYLERDAPNHVHYSHDMLSTALETLRQAEIKRMTATLSAWTDSVEVERLSAEAASQ